MIIILEGYVTFEGHYYLPLTVHNTLYDVIIHNGKKNKKYRDDAKKRKKRIFDN